MRNLSLISLGLIACLSLSLHASAGPALSRSEAMQLILQTRYEPEADCGDWHLSGSEKAFFEKQIEGQTVAEHWRVCPYRQGTFTVQGRDRAYLLLQSQPAVEPGDCHSCSPLIGAAILEKGPDGWQLVNQSRYLAWGLGTFGQTPPAHFVDIGSDRKGFLIDSGYSNMGISIMHKVLIGEVNGKLVKVWQGPTVGNNSGMAPPHPRYQYQSQIKFVPVLNGRDNSWPELHQIVTGTYTDAKNRVVSVAGTRIYRFNGSVYRPIKVYPELGA